MCTSQFPSGVKLNALQVVTCPAAAPNQSRAEREVTWGPGAASLLQEMQKVGLTGSAGSMVLLGRLSRLTHALQLRQVQGFCAHDRLLLLLLGLPNAWAPAQLLSLPRKAALGTKIQAS